METCLSLMLLLIPVRPAVQAQPTAEDVIRDIHQQYVDSWVNGDAEGVMGLFETEATIVPSGMAPITGSAAIREFWFPDDSSVTKVHQFRNEVLSISIEDTLAYTFQRTFLSWSYSKGEFRMGRNQWGVAMTILRRQPDAGWKIWKQVWFDVRQEAR